MPDENALTIYVGTTTFRKDGSPVMGSVGSRAGTVVVITHQTWKQMVLEHPTLATAKFRVGEL